MKKTSYILLGMLLYPLCLINAQQRQLTDFASLIASLNGGGSVSCVFDYSKCRMVIDSVEEKAPAVFGGFNVNAWEYFPANTVRNPKGFVTFSESVLITHPRHGVVWNYVKCKVYEDCSVEITAKYFSPLNYNELMSETFFTAIDDGRDKGGAKFILK